MHQAAVLQRREPGQWQDMRAYQDVWDLANTKKGREEYKRYRRELCYAQYGPRIISTYTDDQDQIVCAMDNAVPRSSSIRECIAFATMLTDMIKGGNVIQLWSVDQLLEQVSREHLRYANHLANDDYNPVYVVRETTNAAFFTRLEHDGAVTTFVLMRRRPEAVMDLFRTLLCDFGAVYDHLPPILYSLLGNFDTSSEYMYIEIEHAQDRYRVTKLQPVTTNSIQYHSLPNIVSHMTSLLGGVDSSDLAALDLDRSILPDVNEPEPLDAGQPSRATYFVVFGYQNIPTMRSGVNINVCDIAALFDGLVTLDVEYKTYCNPNCERPAGFSSSWFARAMQIQSRIAALAGLMARRYSLGMSAQSFAKNMMLTAQSKGARLDMANTIGVLSQLDLRRGPGTYSSFIRNPPRPQTQPQSVLEHVPHYMRTWKDFLTSMQTLLPSPLRPH